MTGARVRVLLLAFLSGACLMVVELVAPRLVAPHLGTTVLTWTVVIATFLGSLALGNALGGGLADRAPRGLLPTAFAAAAVGTAAVVPLEKASRFLGQMGVPHALRVALAVPATFLLPAFALGVVAPALGRAALRADDRPGRALGGVSAAGALGSVVGTFAAGFLLIPSFGVRAIVLGTAGALAVAALLALRIPLGERREPTIATASGRWGTLAFLAGFALLSLEIVMGRVAADRIGNSLYTWTSVIGVVLVGIALGNAVGGRLADRHESRTLLAVLLLVASGAAATCLWTPWLMRFVLEIDALPWPARTLLATAVAFLLPSAALGMVSPAVARAALAEPGLDGRVVGRLYALGSLGAVLGAGATGFFLVPLLGVPALVAALALALGWAAGRVRGRHEVPWLATVVVLGLLARLPVGPAREVGRRLGLREDGGAAWVADSRYFRIRVTPTDARWVRLAHDPSPDLAADPLFEERADWDAARRLLHWRGRMRADQAARLAALVPDEADRALVAELWDRTTHDVRILTLDKLVHGYVDLQDPRWLGYDYEVLYAGVVDRLWPKTPEPRAFFIGGGSYTFQRRLVLAHPGTECVTAEIDPAVTEAAREALGLVEHPGLVVRHEDARTYVDGLGILSRGSSRQRFDLAFGDAFNDLSVPYHLTTVEFARALKARMADDGVYLVNVVDRFDSGLFLGAFLRTLEATFANVRLLSAQPRHDDEQDTFVLVASDRDLDLRDLRDDRGRPLPAVLYAPEDLAALRARPGPPVLTDDHAPVESLLAPVVRARGSR